MGGGIVFINLGKFGEQVIETPLLCQSTDLVISTPEATDKDSPEKSSQDLFDHGGSPAFSDEIIAEVLGGKTPQPVGDSIKPPSGLISVEHSACGGSLANVIINRVKDNGEVFPGLRQSSCAYFKSTNHGKDPDDIIEADSDQIMKPCC